MGASSISPAGAPRQSLWQRVFSRPSTRLGWWAVALAVVFAVLVAVLVPVSEAMTLARGLRIIYGLTMLGCGLAAGVVALVAVFRRHERSWLVCFPLFFGLMVLALILGEFLFPH